MTEQTGGARKTPAIIDRLKDLLPARLRRGVPVVPVVRLSGV